MASAEHAVAKQALEWLNSLLTLSPSSDSLSENEEDQIEAIVRLFNEQEDLFLSDNLEKRFYEVYHKNLAANWLDLIKSSNRFFIIETRVGQKSYCLVSLAKPAVESIDTPAQPSAMIEQANGPSKSEDRNERNTPRIVVDECETESAKIEISNGAVLLNGGSDFYLESNEYDDEIEIEELETDFLPEEETRCTNLDEVAFTYEAQFKTNDFFCPSEPLPLSLPTLHTILELPSDLELPTDRDWTVHVLDVTESGHLMLRLSDDYAELQELTSQMNRFYVQLGKGKLKKLLTGNCYAVVFGETVFRAQVLQLLPDNQVRCRFLDDGVVEVVSCDNLFEIDRQFLKLPWQSFQAKLDDVGLDLAGKYAPLIRLFFDLKMLEHENTLHLVAKPTCLEPVTVHLFDTSHPDRDLDLNELLINFVSRK